LKGQRGHLGSFSSDLELIDDVTGCGFGVCMAGMGGGVATRINFCLVNEMGKIFHSFVFACRGKSFVVEVNCQNMKNYLI